MESNWKTVVTPQPNVGKLHLESTGQASCHAMDLILSVSLKEAKQ